MAEGSWRRKNFIRRRKALGWSQEQLKAKINELNPDLKVGQGYISQVENCQRNPKDGFWQTAAKVMHKKKSWLAERSLVAAKEDGASEAAAS